jgi:hypothetical protein
LVGRLMGQKPQQRGGTRRDRGGRISRTGCRLLGGTAYIWHSSERLLLSMELIQLFYVIVK